MKMKGSLFSFFRVLASLGLKDFLRSTLSSTFYILKRGKRLIYKITKTLATLPFDHCLLFWILIFSLSLRFLKFSVFSFPLVA